MNNNYQVTVPRYRENPLIEEFSMLCPGMSLNLKHYHLTLYKGQIWREKSYLKLCNHNVLNIVYDRTANWDTKKSLPMTLSLNGELYVPPVPGRGFLWDQSQIPWDSEILQSFADFTNITGMTFHFQFSDEDSWEVTYQIKIGFECISRNHHDHCAPPHRYNPWYIWTKEGLKLNKKYTIF